MKNQLFSLIELIHKEVDSLQNFLKLLKEEEECLLNSRFDLLEKSVLKQEQAIAQAKLLEKSRKDITASLAKDLEVDYHKTPFSKMLKLLDSSYSSKLDELQSTLLELHRKVEVQRKKNEELIKESMEHIDHNIKSLIQTSPPSYLKDSSPDQGKAKPSLILDKVG